MHAASAWRGRKLWRNVHLWLGLILGFWLSLIGLTGALLVFFYELEEVVHPQLFTVSPNPEGQAAYKPLQRIVEAAESALPDGASSGFAYYPRTDSGAYWFFYEVPLAGKDAADEWHVFVDPYSASVLGAWQSKLHDDWVPREFFMFVFSLHDALLLPWEVGGILVGVIAVLCLVSALVGVGLWWPGSRRWRQALRFKRNPSAERFVFDLHSLSGIYLAPVLLSLLISGIYFNLPDQFFWVVRQFSADTLNRYEVKSIIPEKEAKSIGIEQAMLVAQARYPEGRPDWLYMPTRPDDAYTICFKEVSTVSHFADRSCVVIDQYRGQTLHVTAPGAGSGGNTFVSWQWSLHSGQAFGLPGRILVLLSGLSLPILFITGVVRWQHKRRAARATERRRASANVIAL